MLACCAKAVSVHSSPVLKKGLEGSNRWACNNGRYLTGAGVIACADSGNAAGSGGSKGGGQLARQRACWSRRTALDRAPQSCGGPRPPQDSLPLCCTAPSSGPTPLPPSPLHCLLSPPLHSTFSSQLLSTVSSHLLSSPLSPLSSELRSHSTSSSWLLSHCLLSSPLHSTSSSAFS